MPQSHLNDLGRQLLADAEAALTAAGRPLPDRRYVADGPNSGIAIDAEQLVAIVGPVVPGPPGEAAGTVVVGPGLSWAVSLFVDLARPAPGLTDTGWPTPAEIDASAEGIQADGEALLRAAFAFGARCGRAFNPSLTWIGPEGYYARAVLAFDVALV